MRIIKDFLLFIFCAVILFEPVNKFKLEKAELTLSNTSYYPEKEDILYYHFLGKYEKTNQTAYFISNCNAKTSPDLANTEEVYIPKYSTATLTATNELLYWQISYNGQTLYIDSKCITTSLSEFNEVKNQTKLTSFTGTKLNRRLGRINGPSGQETYYNLNMNGVISIMRRMGNTDLYWIRDDGVKMLGDYVMVAADLSIRPRGSLIECSLGMGIVCDTGAFTMVNPTQLDIAVNW